MKPTFKVLLSLVLMLSLLSPALADLGVWEQKDVLDKFRRPTGEVTVINSDPFTGVYSKKVDDFFSKYTVTDQYLTANIILDNDSLRIVLYENGRNKVTGGDGSTTGYSISLLTENGAELSLYGYIDYFKSEDGIIVSGDSRVTLLRALSSEPSLSVYIEEKYHPENHYFFTIPDTSGFAEACLPIFQRTYDSAIALMADGNYKEAMPLLYSIIPALDSEKQYLSCLQAIREQFNLRQPSAKYISADYCHTVGLKADGTVVAVGYNEDGRCNVENWTDIVAVARAAGGGRTFGLKADGTIVAVGSNWYNQCNTESWTDIVAIEAGSGHIVGLKVDGTVVAVGNNESDQCNVESWRNIVAVAAGGWHTVGLKADGTVVAVGDNDRGKCNVGSWRNIVAVAAEANHTVGLSSDGTVVAVGSNTYNQCNVSGWRDIVAVAAGGFHTVGLKADGTVVAVGDNGSGQCNVGSWTDIVAIEAGYFHTIGLRSDGTVVAVGDNYSGQCNVESWTNIGPGVVN